MTPLLKKPLTLPVLDAELIGMVEYSVALDDKLVSLDLAREYARYLMGWREKSPAADSLTIMQNQYVRSETWRIVRRHGLMRRTQVDWTKHLRGRGIIVI